MKAMLAVRGNLAANPRFWPERKDEDGHVLQARWTAVVIETRRRARRGRRMEGRPDGGHPLSRSPHTGARAAMTPRPPADMHCGDPKWSPWANRRPLKRTPPPAAASRPPACAWTALAVLHDTIMMRRHAEHVAQRKHAA